jgi:hypothetical protein
MPTTTGTLTTDVRDVHDNLYDGYL